MTIDNEVIDNLLKDYKSPRTSAARTASCVIDIRYSPGASLRSSPEPHQGEKRVLIQTLLSQSAVETLDQALSIGLPAD